MFTQALGQKDKHGFAEGQAWKIWSTRVAGFPPLPPRSLKKNWGKEKQRMVEEQRRGSSKTREHPPPPSWELLVLPPPTQSCPKRPRGWWDTSDPATGITHSLDVLLSWVPSLPQAPAMDVQSRAGTRARAPQSPQPLLPPLLQKHCWDHPPSPLGWLFTSPNSDLNYEILSWY